VEDCAIVKEDMESGKRRIFCDLEKEMMRDINHFYINREKILNALPPKIRIKIRKDDELLKNEDMEHTQRFISSGRIQQAVLGALLELAFTHSSTFAYFFMIMAMMIDAGMISLIYPISLFGYALLEEERPGAKYWLFIQVYTVVILVLKFLFQMDIFLTMDNLDSSYHNATDWLKVGLKRCNSSAEMIWYILPQMGILVATMAQCFYEMLIGLHDKREIELETIQQARERFLRYLKGDNKSGKTTVFL